LDVIEKRHAAEAESAVLGGATEITDIFVLIRVPRHTKEKVDQVLDSSSD
jgi:hypothetical protein